LLQPTIANTLSLIRDQANIGFLGHEPWMRHSNYVVKSEYIPEIFSPSFSLYLALLHSTRRWDRAGFDDLIDHSAMICFLPCHYSVIKTRRHLRPLSSIISSLQIISILRAIPPEQIVFHQSSISQTLPGIPMLDRVPKKLSTENLGWDKVENLAESVWPFLDQRKPLTSHGSVRCKKAWTWRLTPIGLVSKHDRYIAKSCSDGNGVAYALLEFHIWLVVEIDALDKYTLFSLPYSHSLLSTGSTRPLSPGSRVSSSTAAGPGFHPDRT
jgi:hypothetical protein